MKENKKGQHKDFCIHDYAFLQNPFLQPPSKFINPSNISALNHMPARTMFPRSVENTLCTSAFRVTDREEKQLCSWHTNVV